MADGPYRGDFVLAAIEKERTEIVANIVRERRALVVDAFCAAAGVIASLGHAAAPWSVIFEILRVEWAPYASAVTFAAFGIWSTTEAIRLHRLVARLD